MAGSSTIPLWSLCDRLEKSREHAGLSTHDMAKALGVSERTIRNYEAGASTIRQPAVIAWAAVTGVPRWWIENGGDQPPADTVTAWYPCLAAA